jgi:heat-inducible transcriptional repressor
MKMDDRKKQILCAVVKTYILTGEPVGSKLIAQETAMGLSSATIRNEMAALTEAGLIEQPHTSAGRIPTQRGYRLYVDRLMERYQLSEKEKDRIESLLGFKEGDIESTLEKAGELLADITGCAAVSTAPQDKSIRIRRIEVMGAGARSLLFVILTTAGVIKSSLCRVEEDLTGEMVSFFSRLVNEKFGGKTLEEVTPALVEEAAGELFEYTYALSPVLALIAREVRALSDAEVFFGGEANLLAHREFDGETVAKMLRYLERRDALARLMDGLGSGVNVRIGRENGSGMLQDSSLIAAPYAFQGKAGGSVGIIGPTRMHYAKLMSHIDYFARVLSKLVNEAFGDV